MASVFKLLLTVSEQKSKFRAADFRVFVLSIGANSKTRKSRKDCSQLHEFFYLSGSTWKNLCDDQ